MLQRCAQQQATTAAVRMAAMEAAATVSAWAAEVKVLEVAVHASTNYTYSRVFGECLEGWLLVLRA